MVENDDGGAQPLDAGDFSAWLGEVGEAIAGRRGSDVPCDGCTACCTSSQFVHIAPDETDTLAHIPHALLFPAPRMPPGHVLLGYDERGHCPMLVDRRCSIYDHRPRTCRTYDCRVFPAAEVVPDKPAIAERTARWRFGHPSLADTHDHDSVRAATAFLADMSLPGDATRRAVLAVEICGLFRDPDQPPDPEVVLAEVRRRGG